MSDDEPKKTSGKMGAIVALVVLTLVAGGAGAGHGLFLYQKLAAAPKPNVAEPSAKHDQASSASGHGAPAHGAAPAPAAGAKPKVPSKIVARDMQPLITNLSMPADMWVRLEATLLYDQADLDNPDVAMAEISGDLLGFLRSLTLRELQGNDGLMFLRQDLRERVILRSQNKIRDIIIQALVVQ